MYQFIAGLSVIPWFLIWWTLIPESPKRDRFISTAEKNFLKETTTNLPDEKVSYFLVLTNEL